MWNNFGTRNNTIALRRNLFFWLFLAAHCIQNKNVEVKLLPRQVVVWLGRNDLSVSNERNAIKSTVKNIQIHPDWVFSAVDFDADIAIMVLVTPVEFSYYVQPACFHNDNVKTKKDGTVVKLKHPFDHQLNCIEKNMRNYFWNH